MIKNEVLRHKQKQIKIHLGNPNNISSSFENKKCREKQENKGARQEIIIYICFIKSKMKKATLWKKKTFWKWQKKRKHDVEQYKVKSETETKRFWGSISRHTTTKTTL